MDDVQVLTSFTERLLGVRGVAGAPVLLSTRSIHTFGLRRPISVVELDLKGVVQSARVVPPRRMLRFPGLRWVLEYGSREPLPAPGRRLTLFTGTSEMSGVNESWGGDKE